MTDTKHPASETPPSGPLWRLNDLGQSVWLDYIRRGILQNGELEKMVKEKALRGVTSNPAIFEQAIGGSDDYDEALEFLASEGVTAHEAYEALALEDIRWAADIFRNVYGRTDGRDGFVSLEVSPELAQDTEGTLTEARRLWKALDRPNVMIKVPGTDAGLPAIETLLAEGINVNITLLFSIPNYEQVMESYLRALEARHRRGLPLDRIASVASFFVSRVDSAIDARLEDLIKAAASQAERAKLEKLRGRAAIANARLAYQKFEEAFGGERFRVLALAGARVQRPLWASTSTKNPTYRDVVYVEELVGPDTVNTMPLATLEAFADHGDVRRSIDVGLERGQADLAALGELGISIQDVTEELQREGVEKFVLPFRDLLARIDQKLATMSSAG